MLREEQSEAFFLLLCAFDCSEPHGGRVLCRHIVRSYFTMNHGFTMKTPYGKTLALFGETHARDPKTNIVEELRIPYELHYALMMATRGTFHFRVHLFQR